jgi:hypothetical protein
MALVLPISTSTVGVAEINQRMITWFSTQSLRLLYCWSCRSAPRRVKHSTPRSMSINL